MPMQPMEVHSSISKDLASELQSQDIPVLSKKEGKKRLCDLRNQLEPLIAGGP